MRLQAAPASSPATRTMSRSIVKTCGSIMRLGWWSSLPRCQLYARWWVAVRWECAMSFPDASDCECAATMYHESSPGSSAHPCLHDHALRRERNAMISTCPKLLCSSGIVCCASVMATVSADAAGWGSVKGRVVLKGEVPQPVLLIRGGAPSVTIGVGKSG